MSALSFVNNDCSILLVLFNKNIDDIYNLIRKLEFMESYACSLLPDFCQITEPLFFLSISYVVTDSLIHFISF